jgi:hypothetical protein
MYVIVAVVMREGSEPVETIRRDFLRCFAEVAAAEVNAGCYIATADSVVLLEELVSHLAFLERGYDPQLDIALFFSSAGSRWFVTDRIFDMQRAAAIAGRMPEVV